MSEPAPPVLPLGEAAWTVVLGDSVCLALHQRVTHLAERIRAARLPGVTEVVPAYAAVTVFFDPDGCDPDALRSTLAQFATATSVRSYDQPDSPPSRLVTIPVRYNGPDLSSVASATGLSEAEVVRRHAGREYRVYLLGFAPGWAYLGDLDPSLILPRRPAPRTRVPTGSVAIAGAQTGVYPLATPGGWHLLGATSVVMFDPANEAPALLGVGDRVRFEPVE